MATNTRLNNAVHDLIRTCYIETHALPPETTLEISSHLGGMGEYKTCLFRYDGKVLVEHYGTVFNKMLVWAHDTLKKHGEV